MTQDFACSLDTLSSWRQGLTRRLDEFSDYLSGQDLSTTSTLDSLKTLKERLGSEKLVVAFVAEFSRGKSELINAIFFSDAGKRVLPATPGRTTMCPVELGYNEGSDAELALLPIETRLEGPSLMELRERTQVWTRMALQVDDGQALSESLLEVMRTQWVSVEMARDLGFWDDKTPEDNPPTNDAGQVEVPKWRHALINYPHPLLKQGLVVLDTPGLNAIGAEPELTLSLLPSAHATVFILGADTGVTKSDLSIWRDHLSSHPLARYVVLNKIDALIDPMATAEQVQAQIESQRQATARTLRIPPDRVFPLSARQALAARFSADEAGLVQSRLPELEVALSEQLLPQRRKMLELAVGDVCHGVEAQVMRRLGDSRRQLAEQAQELRGLRGKSATKVNLMLKRVQADATDFEQCTTRLQALRMVHARMMKDALIGLSSDRVREEVETMQAAMTSSILNLGAKKAFLSMCGRLDTLVQQGQKRCFEMRQMLEAAFGRLNAEFGFALALEPGPDLSKFREELELIQRNYVQYLGLTLSLRLSQPKFMEQFRRMLVSKLRVVFENASSQVEMWNKAASVQVDGQLRERRRGFRRRSETLQRIQSADGELEQRISEIESQDELLQQRITRVTEHLLALRAQAEDSPWKNAASDRLTISLPLNDEPVPDMLLHTAKA
jgi:Dynamin family